MENVTGSQERVEERLWPFVEEVARSWSLPGLAIAVVHDGDQVLTRAVGSRDAGTGEPVTPDTVFHLASVSKTVVSTAVLRLVDAGRLDLDAAVARLLPDLPWVDPRADAVTVRHLLSHRSGLSDVPEYSWHRPATDDDALARRAAEVAGWRLEHEPGTSFSYCNAGFDLLGHLLATLHGRPFEAVARTEVLEPAGMDASTFLPSDVPDERRARPHLGLPPRPVPGAYPWSRSHAPSSSLHASAADMGRWMTLHLAGGRGLLSAETHHEMWRAQAPTGWDERQDRVGLGWFRGVHLGQPLLTHLGSDPGFESHLALLPQSGAGVSVLSAGNTAPMQSLARAALDVLLGTDPAAPPPPPVTVPLAPILEREGVSAAAELYRRVEADASGRDPGRLDLSPDGFADAVWGLIEMHRTDLARPVLELWARVQPESSALWFHTGWALSVEGRPQEAETSLRRALVLDPEDDEARALLARVTAAG